MSDCKHPRHQKWSVRKSDGAWVVRDYFGTLRFACDNHPMALMFALLKGPSRPWLRPVSESDYRGRGISVEEIFRAARAVFEEEDDE